jgi:hypothetical protein
VQNGSCWYFSLELILDDRFFLAIDKVSYVDLTAEDEELNCMWIVAEGGKLPVGYHRRSTFSLLYRHEDLDRV